MDALCVVMVGQHLVNVTPTSPGAVTGARRVAPRTACKACSCCVISTLVVCAVADRGNCRRGFERPPARHHAKCFVGRPRATPQRPPGRRCSAASTSSSPPWAGDRCALWLTHAPHDPALPWARDLAIAAHHRSSLPIPGSSSLLSSTSSLRCSSPLLVLIVFASMLTCT